MTLKTNRIENLDGSKGIATDYVIDGSAKAWANLNGKGAVALRDSMNISSAVDNGIGDFSFNVSNAMANTNYSFNQGVSLPSTAYHCFAFVLVDGVAPLMTGVLRGQVKAGNAAAPIDVTYVTVSINGDLA